MTRQFIIQYAKEQFGVPAYAISEAMVRAAQSAWTARQELEGALNG